MTKPLTSLEDLERLTHELEVSVPSIRGSFPDFRRLSEEWLQFGKRCSYYVFGTIKSGKSTMVNALMQADLLPRGSGVKTFSRARVVHHERRYGRIVFLTNEVLAENFSHDFRMLGFAAAIPPVFFDRSSIEALISQFEHFSRQAKEDGRFERIANRDHQYSLLGLAYTRLERTLAGLDLLVSHAQKTDLAQIEASGALSFLEHELSAFRAWLDVSAYAPLIEDVEVGTPYPQHLPKDIEIIDCQGSDSLNPLDFASLDEVIHKTDHILYVINSRLGLREGDARLLAHLRDRAAVDKLTIVINAEAYQPYDLAESNRLLGRTQEDLARALGTDNALPKIFILNGLYELNQCLDADEARRIEKSWTKQGCRDVFQSHRDHFQLLAKEVLQQDFVRESSAHVALPSLVAHATKTVEALLGRDEALLGVKAQRASIPASLQAFERIIAGERDAIVQTIATQTGQSFATSGHLSTRLQSFLKQRDAVHADINSLGDLAGSARHGSIMAHASECFHRHWNAQELDLQKTIVGPLTMQVKSTLLQHLAALHGMLPTAFSDDLLAVIGPWAFDTESFLNQMQLEMDHILADITRPVILRPIILPPAVDGAIVANFYARKIFGLLKAKITGKDVVDNPKKIRRLWTSTIDSLFKYAAEDAQFSVSSCRENLKFQYYYKLVDRTLNRVLANFEKSLAHHSETFARLNERQDILLNPKERMELQSYLQQIKSPNGLKHTQQIQSAD